MRYVITLLYAITAAMMISSCSDEIPDQAEEQKDRPPKEIFGDDGAPMLLIPAGAFQMGAWNVLPEVEVNESGETVYLDGFYMDKCEVTNAQYREFVKQTGYKEPEGRTFAIVNGVTKWDIELRPWTDPNFNGDEQPVVCVSWHDARAYAEWAGKRLPTEAEWEKAARGKLVGKTYTWGNKWPPPSQTGNFADESFVKEFHDIDLGPYFLDHAKVMEGYNDGYVCTSPVGEFRPNGYGLYDIVGNVREWCADDYVPPECQECGGASWIDNYELGFRVAFRHCSPPAYGWSYLGFRCVRDVPEQYRQK